VSKYRKLIKSILKDKIKLVVIDVGRDFVYFDKTDKGWRLTISKRLIGDSKND